MPDAVGVPLMVIMSAAHTALTPAGRSVAAPIPALLYKTLGVACVPKLPNVPPSLSAKGSKNFNDKLLEKVKPEIDSLGNFISTTLSNTEKKTLSDLMEKIYGAHI